MLIRSMDGPLRVLKHLTMNLRTELDKTARDLQEEFPITETGIEIKGISPQGTQRECMARKSEASCRRPRVVVPLRPLR